MHFSLASFPLIVGLDEYISLFERAQDVDSGFALVMLFPK